jgi:hypothetical protein
MDRRSRTTALVAFGGGWFDEFFGDSLFLSLLTGAAGVAEWDGVYGAFLLLVLPSASFLGAPRTAPRSICLRSPYAE